LLWTDCNKIIRAAYGHEIWYQNLTLRALDEWEAWNQDLASGRDLPSGMTTSDRVYVNAGVYHFGDESGGLNPFEKESVANLKNVGKAHTQYLLSESAQVERAKRDGFGHGVDPFRLSSEGQYPGYLDTIGGFTYADKACRYVLHQAHRLGVRFVLDKIAGQFQGFVEDKGRVVGIATQDGKTHPATTTIVACGGWTPSILPEMDGLIETTAGSVAMIQVAENSPLRTRFAPDNFPVWQYRVRAGADGSLYGFPLDERGVMKLGYRGTKYTNPQSVPGQKDRERSVPITRWTSPSIENKLPQKSVEVIRKFLDAHLPELRENGINISNTRLCWYTDSFDNHFVIDAVPSRPGVIVATGGSGHAFKFLPVIGKYVADRVEGNETDDIMKFWRWRSLKPGEKAHNVLGKGTTSPTALQNVKFSDTKDFLLGDMTYRAKL
jgi:glycine/D-amino acid oxidase-like deaminating enzyme